MYSVLVADDNSNIQKMVSLALKDEGIEVYAVGNGEAAVRRLDDSPPDLILADIFMPVRNGYEVCEFVKRDERFQHIPVILLVGAFDPLDDEEVRRVRADGVLKKPFVPPDPLIALVKSTLERAPGRREPASAAAAPPAAPIAAPFDAPPAAAAPPPAEASAPEAEEPEATLPRAPDFSMDQAGPLAFGSLLDAPPEPTEPPPPSLLSHQPDETFRATSIPDDDVAAAQLEAAGYFAMDSPALPPPEPAPPAPAEVDTVRESALPDWSSLSAPGHFADAGQDAAAPGAPEPPPVEQAAAAPPASEPAPAAETRVESESSWSQAPADEKRSAQADNDAEMPATIELLEPVMRPVPAEDSSAPAEPPADSPTVEPPDWAPLEAAAPTEGRVDSFRAPAQPDPELVESVVERVLERLRPQLDEMARDVLRPVAEALLQRELDKVSDRSRN